jgi:hypothetical protein
MGAPDADPTCGITTDLDCLPFPANAPSDGVGPGLVINANLIMGNAAESGSGGGLRLQGLNGTDVITFPSNPNRWYSVSVTNNIITNNVAGWDGAGISLEDALAVNIINNTIVSNDTTASSGVLFNTLGAPLASSQGPCPYGTGTQTPPVACVTASTPQPAGLVAVGNSPQLTTGIAALPTLTGGAKVICPSGHPNCAQVSYPVLDNDVFWQNRTFHIAVGALSTQYQQNIVSLYNGNTGTLAASQTTTGQCPTSASYWDIGVRGDTAPGGTHASGFTLAPTYSVLTDATDYPGLNNLGSNPAVVSQYCNGSRTIPEAKLGGAGWQVPPGISDATVPNPIFSLTPTATVDEGNNWVNIQWGPLTLSPAVVAGTTPSPLTSSTPLGNYSLTATSPAINYIPAGSDAGELAPSTDFFGNPRPDPANLTHIDVGAVEFNGTGGGGGGTPTLTSIAPNTGARGTSVNVTLTGTNLTGATSVNAPGSPNITVTNFVAVSATSVTATLNIATATTLGGHNITVTAPGGTTNAVTFTVTANPLAPTLSSIAPISGVRGAAVPVTFTGTNLTGATWSAANTTLYPNITVTGLTVVNSTTVTATLHIATVTVLGIKNFSLTTPNGTSNNVAFRVTGGTAAFAGPTPALTTATPNTTTKNGTITVTNSATGANAGPLTLTANPIIAKVGAAGGTFSITGGTCVSAAVINPAPTAPTSCTINVQYVPGPSTATATAHVTIADTGAATATQTGANFTAN